MIEILERAISEYENSKNGYEKYKTTHEYQSEEKYLQKITRQFQKITTLFFMAANSAYPNGSHNWFTLKFSDEQLLSSDAVEILALDGIYNSAKCELRYMLEFQLKILYIDQVYCRESIEKRLAFFKKDIQKMSVENLLKSFELCG